MNGRPFSPPTADVQHKLKTLGHALQRAKLDLAQGRLDPDAYATRARVLEARLRAVESEAYAGPLPHLRGTAPWKPPRRAAR